LSERSITVAHYENEYSRVEYNKKVFNINSQTCFDHNYLEYSADFCLKNFVNDETILNDCEVIGVEHLSWIGKHFAVVKERKKSYFETAKSSELRRIDFMDY
jgi:hypothetical protein